MDLEFVGLTADVSHVTHPHPLFLPPSADLIKCCPRNKTMIVRDMQYNVMLLRGRLEMGKCGNSSPHCRSELFARFALDPCHFATFHSKSLAFLPYLASFRDSSFIFIQYDLLLFNSIFQVFLSIILLDLLLFL